MIPVPTKAPLEDGEIGCAATLGQVEALADEWWELWHACAHATPFQAPAWLLPWARHYAPDRMAAITLRQGRRLVALLPYFSWQGALLLAGTGPSDYGDALVAGGIDRTAAARALLDALARAAGALGCTEIDLRQLREDSLLLTAPAACGWRDEVGPDVPCLVLRLRTGPAFAGSSKHWRHNLRHAERLLRDAGAEVGPWPEAGLDGAAAVLERLHRLRWGARGEGGVIDVRLFAFLQDAIPALHAAGLLRFYRIELDGEVVAAAFAMRGAGAVHCYLGGFDPAWARASPGIVVLAAALQAATREGLAEFHLLRGGERYKYGFGAEARPAFRRRLAKVAAPSDADAAA